VVNSILLSADESCLGHSISVKSESNQQYTTMVWNPSLTSSIPRWFGIRV